MDQKENNKQIKISPNQKLSTYSSSLVEKGLEIANQIEIKKAHTISEDELLDFRYKYNQLRKSYTDIPNEFTNYETSNPHNAKNAFPINLYFDVFDKLGITDNFVLDYVYYYSHHGGEPLIYAREFDAPPIETPDEYFEKRSMERNKFNLGDEPKDETRHLYLDYLNFEKSFLGYFQFGLFCVVVDRFYRFWHSCYNDRNFILTRKGLEVYAKQSKTGYEIEKAINKLAIDPRPQVDLDGAKGKVRLIYFDPEGGGLYKLFIYIEWPNKFIKLESETIVEGYKYLF